ncbi:TPA: Fic family protein [Pseudomonas putida]|uniref:Fic family protein n=1 Tax=unclassified Pseudomonas TaxID=196821 RepID=UPI001AE5221C|nr:MULTISPECIES: Fic family protein [unclassified Pseudomonas]MBP2271464.1 Fic family protein [Pseudomonas sp. BP6]MBP2289565.1 Fic family protein [Pseudomonas sp. BP7]HDS1695116.1 Fic family protein [Pseudomonas putida]HDS1700286.1 Fic family protein [Pseudomonas putida]
MAFTPYITQDKATEELLEQIIQIMRLDEALHTGIPAPLRVPMMNLVQLVNSYYSNKIEGNSSAPIDILRAEESTHEIEGDQGLQEVKRHIDAQRRLVNEPINKVTVCAKVTIARLHRELYVGVPERMLEMQSSEPAISARMVPGEFRKCEVRVGQHIPPTSQQMQSHLNDFARVYRLDWIHGQSRLLAAAASHHRLMWIHPFMDGNGRTGRLFTDQYLKAAGLSGSGLWSMSRGFARNIAAYYEMLRAADAQRQGGLDGRGELSDSGLWRWTRFFTETALEQLQYFSKLLEPERLNDRIDGYFEMRSRCALSGSKGEHLPELQMKCRDIYKTLLCLGDQQRNDIRARLGLDEATTQSLLSQMCLERLITLDCRQSVSLKLSRHAIDFLFPSLW